VTARESIDGTVRPALVLAAGLGTRLRPLTYIRAKPAVPVGNEPLVRRIVRWLAAHDVCDLVLNLHHLPETLAAVVGDGSDLSARVRYSWEQPIVLGTAGGVRQALPLLGDGTFLIVNGDTLTDFDLAGLTARHGDSGALVTLALCPNPAPHRYGGVRLDDDGRVTGFVPRGTTETNAYHFVGVQAAEPEAFQALPCGRPADSISGVYDRLLAERPGTIRGYVSPSQFWDIGTVGDYWRTCGALGGAAAIGGRRVHIEPSAVVKGSILWDDIDIGPNVTIDRCIVTDRVRVPAGRTYCSSILLPAEGQPIGPDDRVDGDLVVSPLTGITP
jgi:NDP-sugar pyrophosphorylase family protein